MQPTKHELHDKRLLSPSTIIAQVVNTHWPQMGACLASAALCGVLLTVVLQLYRADLSLPLNYLGDAVVFLSRAKALIQGDWIHYNSRIGMPFGADLWDFPMNITLDSIGMWLTSLFTNNPAILVNVQWIGAMIAAAPIAAYCLMRLGLTRPVAVCLGVVYALQPYGFFRGISHLHSVYYLVPLLATAATELGLGRLSISFDRSAFPLRWLRGVPAYAWIGCIAMGLSYLYSAFFACYCIAIATVLAFLARRQLRDLMTGALLIGILVTVAGIDLSPTLLHWRANGSNPSMAFKHAAEAEIYGLKIRLLLTPNPEHPIRIFREIDRQLKQAKFPFDTENESARLGTVGSLGFLFLLVFSALTLVNQKTICDHLGRLLGVSSALLLACLLLATVGGFSDFFNTFVLADIRAYNRISPFISFFCLVGIGVLLSRLHTHWASRRSWPAVFSLILAGVATCAAFDQAVTSGYLPHGVREQTFLEDREFVKAVESEVPRDAPIFQLPHAEFPIEYLHHRMFNNDHGRPYVHSSSARWSWGAVSGTTSAEWNRQVATLTLPDMLHRLAHRGYKGLWVDLFGYAPTGGPERELTTLIGSAPLRSKNGRYLFYTLGLFNTNLEAVENARNRIGQIQTHPVEVTLERGFYSQTYFRGCSIRSSLRHARIVILNPLNSDRTVVVTANVRPGSPHARFRVAVGNISEQWTVTSTRLYSTELTLPALGQIAIQFSSECKNRSQGCFGLSQLQIE